MLHDVFESMEVEIWKDIEGYEGLYQVSNLGRVRSCDKIVKSPRQASYFKNGRVLSQYLNRSGYMYICLSKDGVHKTLRVHRLVALAFVNNHNGMQYINHKDENKANNKASNLEWCDQEYNINYGTRNERASRTERDKLGRCVGQYSNDGVLICKYPSVKDAEEAVGVHGSCIRQCATMKEYKAHNGKYYRRKKAGGYIWKYEE